MESPESHGISRNLTESQNLTESLESHRIFKILNPRTPKFGVANPRLTPFRRLRMHQAQTVDHAFLPDRTTTVIIANISSQEVWLDKGSTLEEAPLRFFEDLEQVLKADNNSAVPDAPTDTLSVIARPEALVQPLSQDTKIRTQYRGNLTDLPPLRWWRPNFLFLWLPYCFLLLMFSFGPHTYAVLVRDTVLFNEQTGIAMSESSWKIVTEWAPEEELQTISAMELLIQQLSDISARHRRDAKLFHEKDVSSAFRDPSSSMVAEKLKLKSFSFPHYLA